MDSFETFLDAQPHTYYCVVSRKPCQDGIQLPELAALGQKRFVRVPLPVFSSKAAAQSACTRGEEAMPLICLSCFLNIVRSRRRIAVMRLDGTHLCQVITWRSPCETTALLRHDGATYFLEGCRDSGVYWRPVGELPLTVPPLSKCGATDGDCFWGSCPTGWPFLDLQTTTLCQTAELEPLKESEEYRVCLQLGGEHYHCIGVSSDDYTFTPAQVLPGPAFAAGAARNLAIGAANSLFGWVGAAFASEQDARITVEDLQDQVCMCISPQQHVE